MNHRIKWSWVIRKGITKEVAFELNLNIEGSGREMMGRHFLGKEMTKEDEMRKYILMRLPL